MTKAEKIQALENHEFNIKLIGLQMKYAKHISEIVLLSIQLRMSVCQYQIIQSQPIPNFSEKGCRKFRGGLAIVGENNKPEIISRKQ